MGPDCEEGGQEKAMLGFKVLETDSRRWSGVGGVKKGCLHGTKNEERLVQNGIQSL